MCVHLNNLYAAIVFNLIYFGTKFVGGTHNIFEAYLRQHKQITHFKSKQTFKAALQLFDCLTDSSNGFLFLLLKF